MARDGECAQPRSRHAQNHPESRQDRASVWLGRALGPIPLLSATYLMTLGKVLDTLELLFLLSKLADIFAAPIISSDSYEVETRQCL